MARTILTTNPGIPYTGMIPGNMSAGKMLHIQGYVNPNAFRFAVNLCCGLKQSPPDDIALTFSPSFGQGLVIVNHLKKQVWGREVQVQNVLQRGQNFEIILNAEATQFKIAVNGQHYVAYPHYIKRLQRISHITINGDVKIYSISTEGGQAMPAAPAYSPAVPAQPAYPPAQPAYPPAQPAYPPAQPAYPPAQPAYPPAQPAQPAYPSAPAYPAGPTVINNPPLPYLANIPGGMKEGKIIVVKLTVKPHPTRFHVNFQCGMSTNPRSDVAMQFNPRVNQQLINLNTLRNTKWDGNEEKHRGYFPFHPNGTYEIMFLCERQKFKVALNSSHLLEYNHRLPFQNISALQIDGDCVVTQITYH